MKDWEVEKVNELYKEIDVLKKENEDIRKLVFRAGSAGCECECGSLAEDIKEIKEIIESLDTRVQVKREYK